MKAKSIVLALCSAALCFAVAARAEAQEPQVISITAKRFQFTPNEIKVKQGAPVKLELRSEDVAHGFYMKALGIDTEIKPGKTTEVAFTPKAAGRYTVICDHFCGSGHGNMKMTIVVE